jgi:hypothetical protein
MQKFNNQTFLISSLVTLLILIPSFLAAWAEDEGTIGNNFLLFGLAKVFYVLRFPCHTLFWTFFIANALLFYIGLIINCIFYGFVIERLLAYRKAIKSAK